jgi:hypothetical protein
VFGLNNLKAIRESDRLQIGETGFVDCHLDHHTLAGDYAFASVGDVSGSQRQQRTSEKGGLFKSQWLI